MPEEFVTVSTRIRDKVIKTICSCKTKEQLQSAFNLYTLWGDRNRENLNSGNRFALWSEGQLIGALKAKRIELQKLGLV